MINTTLKTYEQGEYTFYNFSDNSYIIKSHYLNNGIINERINKFFNKTSNILKFDDLENTFFIKK